jgi:hypothetical protein
MSKPGNGFAISKEADSVPVNDAYQMYGNAFGNDETFRALTTEAGRQALGAQMAVPIRQMLDYVGTSRKFFEIDVLAQGQIARYDKDINVNAYVVAELGTAQSWFIHADYVEPPTWEVFAPAEIRLKEIQERRFNILDRTQEWIRIATQIQEDTQFLTLLNTTASGNVSVNPAQTSTGGVSKSFLNYLTATVMNHDLPCYGILMHFNGFKDLRGWGTSEVDPVTMREIMETGLYGQIWGIDIIVSRLVGTGTAYAMSEPRFFGVLPIRTEFMVMPDDNPRRATIGYVGYEQIGQAIVNANGLASGSFSGVVS